MNAHTRRAIALIASSIIAGKPPASIYDYAFCKYFSYNGDASLDKVNVYDSAEKCSISGSAQNRELFLYHYGNSKHIRLKIEGSTFRGYDYDTSAYYRGHVNGSSINVYDYQDSHYYNYSF